MIDDVGLDRRRQGGTRSRVNPNLGYADPAVQVDTELVDTTFGVSTFAASAGRNYAAARNAAKRSSR